MIPTGVLPGDGGAYVANSTELIHLEDTDGDGKADRRRTVLSGFGTEDTHHLLHTLRWGPDGWMYLNQSIYIHSHIETPFGVKHLDGGGIWRFDPSSNHLEVLCKGFVNPWGHVIDPFGQSLATDGAFFEGINYVFPGAVFATSPGATRWLSGLNPGSPKHCGLEMVSGDAMPPSMQGRLITNDFRSHRVCVFEIAKQGSGYRSVQLPELIHTQHVAFRPIDVKMGPDGAIYIADWYNPIIQHGEVDFRDQRRDTEHGRIWRITAKNKRSLSIPRYDRLNEDALCGLLNDSAMWVRQFARMELSRRQKSKRDAALEKFVTAASSRQDQSLRRLEQLYVSLCAREVKPELLKLLLQSDDSRVRAIAVRYTGRLRSSLPDAELWLADAINDQDNQVVLESVIALGDVGNLNSVKTFLKAAARPNQDQFLKFALWNAARNTESVWMPAVQSGQLQINNDLAILRLLADGSTQADIAKPLIDQLRSGRLAESNLAPVIELTAEKASTDVLGQLTEWVLNNKQASTTAARITYLQSLARITLSRNLKPDDANELLSTSLKQALDSGDKDKNDLIAQLVELSGQWQCSSCKDLIRVWLNAEDVKADDSWTARGLSALARLPDPSARKFVRDLALQKDSDARARSAALIALGLFDVGAAAEQTLQFLSTIESADIRSGESAATALLARKGALPAIRKALATKSDLKWNAEGARTLVSSLRNAAGVDEELLNQVITSTGLSSLGWKWSDEWARQIIELATTKGDAARGEAIYRQSRLQCIRCHAIGASGGNIGPNLVSLGGSSTPEYILQSLIDPNAKLKEGFQTLTVLTDDGQVLSGLQKARSDTQLQLLLADGTVQTLSTEAIESIKPGRSLMPAGLVDMLQENELVDLTKFLMELGRSPQWTVDTQPRVRNWSLLQWSPTANTLLNRTSNDTAAGNDPALVWGPVPSNVAGRLPIKEAPAFTPHRENPSVAFASFDIECKQAGSIRLEFTSPAHTLTLWHNGRPRPTPTADEFIELSTGLHRFVLGLDVKAIGDSFGCSVPTDHAGGAVIEWRARP